MCHHKNPSKNCRSKKNDPLLYLTDNTAFEWDKEKNYTTSLSVEKTDPELIRPLSPPFEF